MNNIRLLESKEVKFAKINRLLENYKTDTFSFYPSLNRDGRKKYLEKRISSFIQKNEGTTYIAELNGEYVGLIGFRESIWDSEVFGYKVAIIDHFFSKSYDYNLELEIKQKLLISCLSWCEKRNIRFLTSRVNVNDLSAIHCLEDSNFRFIETILWPIIDYRKNYHKYEISHNIRYATEKDLDELIYLARNYYYKYGRFPADNHFTNEEVSNMREKWIISSFEQGHKIIVIEEGKDIAGYFIYFINDNIQEFVGLKYAHLRSAVLSSEYRGKGIGFDLFAGTLNLLSKKVDIVDSGFITRNLPSMNLHWKVGLNKVVFSNSTFHKWFY